MNFTLQDVDNYMLILIGPLLVLSVVDKGRDINICIIIASLLIYAFTIYLLFRAQKYYVVFLLCCIFIRDCIELHRLINFDKIGPLLVLSAVDKGRDINICIIIANLLIYAFTIYLLFRAQKYYVVFLLCCIFIRDCIELHRLINFDKTETKI